jgi:hypothetical protein
MEHVFLPQLVKLGIAIYVHIHGLLVGFRCIHLSPCGVEIAHIGRRFSERAVRVLSALDFFVKPPPSGENAVVLKILVLAFENFANNQTTYLPMRSNVFSNVVQGVDLVLHTFAIHH